MKDKDARRQKRKAKIRAKIKGDSKRPRFTVHRTNLHVYAQLIDDINGKVLATASDIKIKKGTKSEKAKVVGEEIAKLAKTKKINTVVFDRSGFKFHGRIKILADTAREMGLNF